MTEANRGATLLAIEVGAALAFAWGSGAWVEFSPYGAFRWLRATLVLATLACGSARLRAAGAFVVVGIAAVPPAALALVVLLVTVRLDIAAPLAPWQAAVVVSATGAGWTAIWAARHFGWAGDASGAGLARGVVGIGLVGGMATLGLAAAQARAIDVWVDGNDGAQAVLVGLRPLTDTCQLWSAANRAEAPEQLAPSYLAITGRAFHAPRWDDWADWADWDDCID